MSDTKIKDGEKTLCRTCGNSTIWTTYEIEHMYCICHDCTVAVKYYVKRIRRHIKYYKHEEYNSEEIHNDIVDGGFWKVVFKFGPLLLEVI